MSEATSGVPDRRRILVVDDEVALRSLIARAFRERGYEVVEMTDGLGGLDAVRSSSLPFDLVVTNNRMPHLSGPQLAECLRQENPDLPIIHISGSHGHRATALPEDVPTLFKPFNIWELVDEGEKLMQERGQGT
jgi:two-component system, cell cycle sensor histidine kinase and response regulator CckA